MKIRSVRLGVSVANGVLALRAPFLAASMSILLAVGCGGREPSTDVEHLARAKQYLEQNVVEKGVIELKNALQKNPDNLEARMMLGKVYLNFNDGASAEKELRRALELGFDRTTLLPMLGRALYLQAKFDDMLKEVVVPQGSVPQVEAALTVLRGDAYVGLRRLPEATQSYEHALALQPDIPAANVGLARVAVLSNDLPKAQEYLAKALENAPDDADGLLMSGNLSAATGDLEAAEHAYTKAIDASSMNITAQIERCVVRSRLGDLNGAESDLKSMSGFSAEYPRVNYAQGVYELHKGDYKAAVESLEKLLAVEGTNVSALYFNGAAHLALDQLEQAEKTLSNLVAFAPNHVAARTLLGLVRFRAGDYSGAERMLVPVVTGIPDHAYAKNILGQVYFAQGKVEPGLQLLREAAELSPDEGGFSFNLGVGLLKSGQSGEAADVLSPFMGSPNSSEEEKIVALNALLRAGKLVEAKAMLDQLQSTAPDEPLSYTLQGVFFQHQGQNDEARSSFERAMSKKPGDLVAGMRLAALFESEGNNPQARDVYAALLDKHPANLAASLAMVRLDTMEKDFDSARATLEKIAKAHPDALPPRMFLARYYLNAGQPVEALSYLSEIEDQFSGSAAFLMLLAEAYEEANQPASVERTLNKLVRVIPESAHAHYLLGRAYLRTENNDAARQEFLMAVKLDAIHLQANVSLARMMESSGDSNGAQQILQNLEKARPEEPEVLGLRGWLLAQRGDIKGAITSLKEAQSKGASQKLSVDIARLQKSAMDLDGAEETLKNWLQSHPEDGVVLLELGQLYMQRNQPDPAVATFEKALVVLPKSVLAHVALAKLLQDSDKERAYDHATKAFGLAEADPIVLDVMGSMELARGNGARSVELLERAVDNGATSPSIRFHYAKALAAMGRSEDAKKTLDAIFAENRIFSELGEATALRETL